MSLLGIFIQVMNKVFLLLKLPNIDDNHIVNYFSAPFPFNVFHKSMPHVKISSI